MEKVNRYQDMEEEANDAVASAEKELFSTQQLIAEVDQKINADDTLEDQRAAYLGQKHSLDLKKLLVMVKVLPCKIFVLHVLSIEFKNP